jgi:DNA-binding GntR family transcriptional regulator
MEITAGRQPGNIQDSVYTALRKSILNLNLAPGTAISEKEIALRYQVSRTPVRETFIHLAREGLIQVFPQRETLVSRIDFSRVKQEFFLRGSLETAVLEPFINSSEPENFITLEGLIEKQNVAFENNDYIHFVNFDDEFHRTFFETAGQDLSWAVLTKMCGHYHRIRLLTIRLQGIAKNILGQHKKLLRALKKKDLAKAREALREHLHKLGAEEKILREEFPGYFASSDTYDAFNVDFGGLSF